MKPFFTCCFFCYYINCTAKKKGKGADGFLFGLFLICLFTFRFLIEFLKADQVAFEAGMLLNMGQILSIPFVMLGVFLLWSSLRENVSRKDRKE